MAVYPLVWNLGQLGPQTPGKELGNFPSPEVLGDSPYWSPGPRAGGGSREQQGCAALRALPGGDPHL